MTQTNSTYSDEVSAVEEVFQQEFEKTLKTHSIQSLVKNGIISRTTLYNDIWQTIVSNPFDERDVEYDDEDITITQVDEDVTFESNSYYGLTEAETEILHDFLKNVHQKVAERYDIVDDAHVYVKEVR